MSKMIKKIKKIKNSICPNREARRGFVILFAVTLAAILLSISLGVASIALKEIKFSSSASGTNEAFFAADTGAECALFYDKSSENAFPLAGPAKAIGCASNGPTFSGTTNTGSYDFIVTNLGSAGLGCARVNVFKDNSSASMTTTITSDGYNIGDPSCSSASSNPNKVERELKISSVGNNSPIAQDVVWTSMVGVSASGNTLTQTAPTGWGNAGAISTQSMTSGNGYVEWTVAEADSYRIGGLGHGDTDQNFTDVDFGLFPYSTSGILYVIENGTGKGTFSYVTGDVLRVAVDSGVVKYYKNGVLLYTSLVAPTYPLNFDTSLYQPGATIQNAKIAF